MTHKGDGQPKEEEAQETEEEAHQFPAFVDSFVAPGKWEDELEWRNSGVEALSNDQVQRL